MEKDAVIRIRIPQKRKALLKQIGYETHSGMSEIIRFCLSLCLQDIKRFQEELQRFKEKT
jgi:hypothetical protein